MTARTRSLLALLCALACGPGPRAPLNRACETGQDCGAGLSCELADPSNAGGSRVCVAPCASDAECSRFDADVAAKCRLASGRCAYD